MSHPLKPPGPTRGFFTPNHLAHRNLAVPRCYGQCPWYNPQQEMRNSLPKATELRWAEPGCSRSPDTKSRAPFSSSASPRGVSTQQDTAPLRAAPHLLPPAGAQAYLPDWRPGTSKAGRPVSSPFGQRGGRPDFLNSQPSEDSQLSSVLSCFPLARTQGPDGCGA